MHAVACEEFVFDVRIFWDSELKSHESFSYRGALLSTLLHATVQIFTQFAECTSTDCKKKKELREI
jgi:hypothetical protein